MIHNNITTIYQVVRKLAHILKYLNDQLWLSSLDGRGVQGLIFSVQASLQMFRLPPTVQRHQGRVDWSL